MASRVIGGPRQLRACKASAELLEESVYEAGWVGHVVHEKRVPMDSHRRACMSGKSGGRTRELGRF